jgi:NAD(P)-dependent dehydrogenase (short-subunit alcohol dehydrogenase family)
MTSSPTEQPAPVPVGISRLQGRRALVTGGGSGIGLASALRLAAEGASVAVVDLRKELAVKVANQIVAAGGSAVGLEADVGDEAAVLAAVAAAAAELDGLDTVVACAGILHIVPTHEMTLNTWELILRVNLTGAFLTVRHALPFLLDAGGGSIVTIGSVASVVAGGYASCYDASKSGLLGFTRAVGVEYADRGIRANCILPGHVATNLKAHSGETMGTRGLSGVARVTAPMTRRADPSELAAVVAFLCSDDSSFMTGSAVAADGGFTSV